MAHYYKNLTKKDIASIINLDDIFVDYYFEVEEKHFDLYFWGIKK